jgi:hypothetical protein
LLVDSSLSWEPIQPLRIVLFIYPGVWMVNRKVEIRDFVIFFVSRPQYRSDGGHPSAISAAVLPEERFRQRM